MASGWTMARADQGPPVMLARLETCCARVSELGHRRHWVTGRGAVSGMSSPVSTQERVRGSLRSSIAGGNYRTEGVRDQFSTDSTGRVLAIIRAKRCNNHQTHEGRRRTHKAKA